MEKIFRDMYAAILNDDFQDYKGIPQKDQATEDWNKFCDVMEKKLNSKTYDLLYTLATQASIEEGFKWFRIGFSMGQKMLVSSISFNQAQAATEIK